MIMKSTEIKLLPGWVLVKPSIAGMEGLIKLNSGLEIFVSMGYAHSHRAMNVVGTVIRCCDSVIPALPHMEWVPELVFPEQGDIIWYAWNATRNAYEERDRVMETSDHGQCILIKYNRCFAYLQADKKKIFDEAVPSDRVKLLTLLNGFILAKPIIQETVTSKLLQIVGGRKRVDRLMEVVAVGAPNKEYLAINNDGSKCYPDDEFSVVWPGDIVVTEPNTDIPFESDFNGVFEKDICRMQRKDIVCVVPDKNVELVESDDKLGDFGIDTTGGITAHEYQRRVLEKKNVGKKKYYY